VSGEKPMIEKKLVLCGILAIAIGVATILPLEYFMSATAKAAAPDKPWFTIDVPYAYCNPNFSGGNSTTSLYGASIQAVANFSLTPDALKNADARIEYYQFRVYSDQGQIVNMTYYIVYSKPYVVNGISGAGAIHFEGGLIYDGSPSNGGQCLYDAYDRNFTIGFVSDHIVGTSASNLPQAVTDLRNAQTLYIDVSRQCSVTFNGNVTVITPSSNEVLQHIELTRTANGFAYGTYTIGILPLPTEAIEGPMSGPTPTPIAPSNGQSFNFTLQTP
jgi:hypothetical protein